jgi:hypothetical protein
MFLELFRSGNVIYRTAAAVSKPDADATNKRSIAYSHLAGQCKLIDKIGLHNDNIRGFTVFDPLLHSR